MDRGGRRRWGTRWARAMAVPSPMGTASTMAMAVVSMVPRMKGSSPYFPRVGFHTFSKIHDTPRVEKAGLDSTMMEMRYQATRPTKMAAMTASRPRYTPLGSR